MDLLLLPPRFCAGFLGDFFPCWVPRLSLWLFPVSFSPCWVYLPCVLRLLLLLALLGYVPAFFCFTSFVTRSNLSSFSTGSSLQAESLLSVFSCIVLMVSLLVRYSWCPFSSVPISLLPSLSCVGYPLLRRVFLEVSLPLLVAGWLSRLHLFCFYSSFLRLSPLQGFPSSFLFPLLFLLFSFHPVAVLLSILLLFSFPFHLIYCAFFHFIGARLW